MQATLQQMAVSAANNAASSAASGTSNGEIQIGELNRFHSGLAMNFNPYPCLHLLTLNYFALYFLPFAALPKKTPQVAHRRELRRLVLRRVRVQPHPLLLQSQLRLLLLRAHCT